jgi:hypothetical protein
MKNESGQQICWPFLFFAAVLGKARPEGLSYSCGNLDAWGGGFEVVGYVADGF